MYWKEERTSIRRLSHHESDFGVEGSAVRREQPYQARSWRVTW
jgi:hypothetical protein